MPKRRIKPRDMNSRVKRRWRIRRVILGGFYLILWTFLIGVASVFTSLSYSSTVDTIMMSFWIGVSVLIVVASVFARLPGMRPPYVGTACRACHEDLVELLEQGAVDVVCPSCGSLNRRQPPRCGRCKYDLTGVVPDEYGIRTCPECGDQRLLVGAPPGAS